MPLYEYRCNKCSSVFELIQKFSDEPLTVHDNCGGAVERIVSAPALQFKGSGWYINDYAKGKSSATTGSKNSDSSSSSTPAPASTSTDSTKS